MKHNILKWFASGLVVFASLAAISTASAKDIKAGELFTKSQMKYGKYVVRMRAAKGSGIISNFFTYKNGSEQSNTFWEEIDVEVFGKNGARSWQSNLISGLGNVRRTEGVHSGPAFGDGYNTFVLEWTPNYVRWLVNNNQVRRINGGQVGELDEAASFRFNIWPPNIVSWVGPWNPNILPVHMFVNWMEYHEWTGGNNFKLKWRDDFNTIGGRWGKASHTFGENRADFVPANVNTKNGYLVLSMTRQGQEGYRGNPPVDRGGNNSTPTNPAPSNPAPPTGANAGVPAGWTSLEARHSGRCVDVAAGRTTNGGTFHQWACNTNNVNQRFKFEPRGNGYFTVRSQRSNRCIDVPGGSSANGLVLQQYDCWNGNPNQGWKPVSKGGAWFELRAQGTNKCLSVAGGSQNNGAAIQQWACGGGQSQQFRFK